jgi:hypothetical protein
MSATRRAPLSRRSFLTAALAAPLIAACDGGADSTTGRRVTLTVRVARVEPAFVTKDGWQVTLSRALVSLASLTFFDGETLFAAHAPKQRPSPFAGLVPVAHAHPGHYVPGEARGEYLVPTVVDLLAGATLGEGSGVSGPYRSARVAFVDAPGGGPSPELAGSSVLLEGEATKGAEARKLRARVPAADLVTNGVAAIEGCPFTTADVQGNGAVTLTVAVQAWLGAVGLEALPPGATPVDMAGVPLAELTRSLKGADRYRFVFAST